MTERDWLQVASKTLGQLFPEAKIIKHGEHEEIQCLLPYIRGYSGANKDLTVDGNFTAQQLRALADWMDSK